MMTNGVRKSPTSIIRAPKKAPSAVIALQNIAGIPTYVALSEGCSLPIVSESMTGLDMLKRAVLSTHARPAIETTVSGVASCGANPISKINGMAANLVQ